MLISQVVKAAEPFLKDRTIKDAVIGLNLIGIQLDNGQLGIAAVLKDDLPAGCSVFSYTQGLIGEEAEKIAQWSVTGQDDLQRAVGMAVLTAASQGQDLPGEEQDQDLFGLRLEPGDTVGLIGQIAPVAQALAGRVKEVLIFDKAVERRGKQGQVYPVAAQEELLPRCQLVILSGTSLINGTCDRLVQMCSGAREIALVGPSTPMFPQAFAAGKITVLAGAWWEQRHKEEIFKLISLAGGVRQLSKFMLKKTVRCPKA